MRLIHFSDTHLGFTESAKVDPETGINFREQDVYRAFNAVIDHAISRKPDLVIHAGDLFHSARPSNRAIVSALVGFQRLSAARIPVVLIAGNHSVPRVAATGCIFEAMRAEAVVFAERRGDVSHLVLRVQNKAYVDCESRGDGSARIRERPRSTPLSGVESTTLITLFPGEPPRGKCDRSEPAFDEKGNPFGWITRKGC